MSDEEDEPQLPPETNEVDLEERHANELKELEAKTQAYIEETKASAGKGKKAKEKLDAATRETEDWEYKLRERQRVEMDLLLEHLGGTGSGAAGGYAEEKEVPINPEAKPANEVDEAERIRRKKEKAAQKKQNKASKQADREAEREREKREAGPSQRMLETAALARQLAALTPPMRVQEVAADGHCLYRSIGEQLNCARPGLHTWARGPDCIHEEVRALCAGALRRREDEYGAFAELKDGEDFQGYCRRVEHSGDWGGHLELRALADALGVRIVVHRAEEAAPLVLGDAPGAPLQVAYHRHY